MKRAGSILIGLTAGLALASSLPADDTVAGANDNSNPYSGLVVRNVFGLNPPPPPGPAVQPDPPLKITPNGIMTIFGSKQALFKVEPGPGQPGKEVKSYMLSEGQSQDDIEVVKIDDQANIISFNNHGVPQDLPLVAGTASSGPPAGGPPVPGGGNIPIPMPGVPMGGPGRQFNSPALRRGMNLGAGAAVNPSAAVNPYGGGQSILGAGPGYMGNANVPSSGLSTAAQLQQSVSGMTAEQIQAAIIVNQAKAAAAGSRTAALFPPPPP